MASLINNGSTATSLAVVCGVLIVVISWTATSVSSVINPEYRDNLKRSNEFKCELPQLRAIRFQDLLPDDTADFLHEGTIIYPAFTVLSRCEMSGCCNNRSESCKAAEINQVNLVFKNVTHNYDTNRSKWEYLTITAEDHVRCSCQ